MSISATVKNYLQGRGIDYRLVPHPTTGSTHETADAAHVEQDRIAKAVILQDGRGPVMAVIPGDCWLRLHGVNLALGRELELAGEAQAADHFPDCDDGAIPPLGPAYGLESVLDESLASLAFVYFESGDHRHLVKVSGEEFLTLQEGVRRGHFGRRE